MKRTYYECDDCGIEAFPARTVKGARQQALREEFRFLRGKCYCKECDSKRPSTSNAAAQATAREAGRSRAAAGCMAPEDGDAKK